MKEMHEKGVSVKEIIEVLKRTPMHDRIIPAIKSAYDAGYIFLILFIIHLFFFFLEIYQAQKTYYDT